MSLSIVQSLGARKLGPRALVQDGYLTDGSRLFRVMSRFETEREVVLVALEDCSTFEIKALLPCELRGMGLRVVRGCSNGRNRARGRLAEVRGRDRVSAAAVAGRR